MEQSVLKISREQISDLLDRLIEPSRLDSAIDEVRRMLAIKQRLAMYSDVSC